MVVQAAGENNANLAIYGVAFLLTTLGIVYVQEAERKIPMNYANRYRAGALSPQSYLPFKARHCREVPMSLSQDNLLRHL